jgi:hypothetical protein
MPYKSSPDPGWARRMRAVCCCAAAAALLGGCVTSERSRYERIVTGIVQPSQESGEDSLTFDIRLPEHATVEMEGLHLPLSITPPRARSRPTEARPIFGESVYRNWRR